MNAPNLLSADKRNAERKAYEPSMEEILASIRRIIADDQAFLRQSPAPRPLAEPKPLSEPRPLAEPKPLAETPAAQSALAEARPSVPDRRPFAKERAAPESVGPISRSSISGFPVEAQFQFFEAAAVSRAVEPSPAEAGSIEPAGRRESSIGEAEATPGVAGLPVESLAFEPPQAQAPAPEESGSAELPLVSPQTDAAVSSAFNALVASRFLQFGDGLDDMVREMIRPMLKAWLDDNLPILVERLVRAEIERVARGGR